MKKAFTLIELLVVLAIIGILAAMIIASLAGARARARDATRKSDLAQIKTALETYNNDHDAYPSDATWAALTTTLQTDPVYMKTVPQDPTQAGLANDYVYTPSGTPVDDYTMHAHLERPVTAGNCWVVTPDTTAEDTCP